MRSDQRELRGDCTLEPVSGGIARCGGPADHRDTPLPADHRRRARFVQRGEAVGHALDEHEAHRALAQLIGVLLRM